MLAPMVEDMRNVTDFAGPLRRAEGEIVVLRQIKFLSKTIQLEREKTAVGAQVPDVHRRAKQLRVPFRFEKRRVPLALLAQSIFVAVKNIRGRGFRGGAR